MRIPEFPLYHDFPDTIKGWEAKEKNRAEWYAYWEWMSNRRFHALPEDKGIPVPGTGKISYRKHRNGSGVSASSRVLSHYYADEGEKGRGIRKLVRNRERALWLTEWAQEQTEEENTYDAETVGQWFYDYSDDVDSDVIPSVYTVGETVVEWPNDYYDEYGYDPGPYNVYDYVDFDPYDFEGYGSYCTYCRGECEL